MTVSYPNLCYNEVYYKGTALYIYLGLDTRKLVFGGFRTTKARTSCMSAQSYQHLYYSPIGKIHIKTCYKRNFNSLASPCS